MPAPKRLADCEFVNLSPGPGGGHAAKRNAPMASRSECPWSGWAGNFEGEIFVPPNQRERERESTLVTIRARTRAEGSASVLLF